MREILNISKNILKDENSNKNKEIATIHFFKKKDDIYKIRILIKFLPNQNIKYQDVASKIMIIVIIILKIKQHVNKEKMIIIIELMLF